jgi:hypothetical protein
MAPAGRLHGAWVEGDLLVGEGIVNDKGPMAAFLTAAKAIKNSCHRLEGDLMLTAVIAETSREPVDDPPGSMRESKELSARFLVTGGGVADYVLVAAGQIVCYLRRRRELCASS